MDIKIPHLGDGIESGTVLSISVKSGDSVNKEDVLLELETDKAVAPVPSTLSGTVEKLLVNIGQSVKVGQPFISLNSSDSTSEQASTPVQVSAHAVPESIPVPPPVSNTGVLHSSKTGSPPPTSPSIRKISHQIGLDLSLVPGSGSGGRITLDDLRSYIYSLQHTVSSSDVPLSESSNNEKSLKPALDLSMFSKWGSVSVEDASSLRQTIGKNLVQNWNSIPHVTQFDSIDITDLMSLRKRYNEKYKKKGTRLTLTTISMVILARTLELFPSFNCSYCSVTGKLFKKDYYNIGVAVDTPTGLVVPVIRDILDKSVFSLCQELDDVAEKARNRKLSVEDMQGSSITLSNLGGFGVGAFTPIVNAPDVAILGISAGQFTPVYNEKGTLEKRLLMPLSFSYDHQIIDGADGARFIKEFKEQCLIFDEGLLKEKS